MGGRPPGAKNKRTIEREIRAAQIAARTMENAIDAKTKPDEYILGVDVLMRFVKIFEGAAGHFQPQLVRTPDGRTIESQPSEATKWPMFGEWADRAVTAAKELAKYQSPTFKAIAIAAPAPELKPDEDRKRIVLKVFDGGKNVIPMQKDRAG